MCWRFSIIFYHVYFFSIKKQIMNDIIFLICKYFVEQCKTLISSTVMTLFFNLNEIK